MQQKMKSNAEIQAKILELTSVLEGKNSICPSAVAKALESDERLWRRHLTSIRREAIKLAQAGMLVITRKGKPQDPNGEIKGILRLRKPEDTPPIASPAGD